MHHCCGNLRVTDHWSRDHGKQIALPGRNPTVVGPNPKFILAITRLKQLTIKLCMRLSPVFDPTNLHWRRERAPLEISLDRDEKTTWSALPPCEKASQSVRALLTNLPQMTISFCCTSGREFPVWREKHWSLARCPRLLCFFYGEKGAL